MGSVSLPLFDLCLHRSGKNTGLSTQPANHFITVSNTTHATQAVATACSYLFRSLGCVFGISMLATAFNLSLQRFLRNALRGDADADEIALKVRQSLAFIKTLDPKVQEVVVECYARSTMIALSVGVGLVVGSAVFAWFIREKRLGK